MTEKWLWIAICAIFLGGCWDRTEINDLAIVTAASVDKAANNHVLLSVQVFIPRALGGNGAAASEGDGKLTLMRNSEGVNIADAMSKLQTKISRQIFWGHCKVFLFGEERAKQGLADDIDYLVRHPEPRNRSFLYISKGKGLDMLTITPFLERSTADLLREFGDLNIAMPVTLIDFRNMLRGESEAVALPMIENGKKLNKPEEVPLKDLLVGTAVLKRDKMVGTLPAKATPGLLWLRDELTKAAISVRLEDMEGIISITPSRSKTVFLPRIENGKWSMLVRMDIEGDVVENGTRLNLMNPEYMAMLNKGVRDELDRQMKKALLILQHDLRADVVNFAAAFHRQYPKEWEKAQKHWDEIFPRIEVKTDIRVNIRRPGLIFAPAGIPQSEVKNR